MLKLILTGVWVAVVTLGSVYASIQMSKPVDLAEEAAKKKAVEELVRGEVVTLPVISGDQVEGYFVTKTSYIVDKTKMAEVTLPIPALLTDELYTALVGDKLIRVKDNHGFDLKAFRERVKKAVNTRLGSDIVLDVIIEQVDYLSKDDIRIGQEQKKSPTATKQIVSEKVPNDIDKSSAADASNAH
ncbi:MAG: hypothetical protein JWM58_3725 [Rhizobium sp.]|nr:hypothetical protein [Rhizobium sp.]